MPSHLQVKNLIKVVVKDLNLLKGFAVRSRRPARNVSDMAQTFLPVVLGVAGAIPIAGPPTQAVISGLLSILQLIDRRSQNKADLACLASRLRQLSLHLYNAPITQDPLEQGRRDSIFGILQETFEELIRLQNCRPESASVTQAIARCSNQIDRYLVDCLWSSQMQTHEALAILLRKQQDSVGPQLTAAVALDCVTLMDATGHEHRISVTFCTSFQQLNATLQALFKCDSIEARLQRRYMEQGQYDLCIDDDKQVTRLTNHEWPSIEAGTTIVMRVVFEEEKADFGVKRKCHFCGAVNHIDDKYSLQRHAGSSINCRVCKRRFQISHESSRAKRSTQSSDIDSDSRTEAEMHLIRNFYVQRTYPRPPSPPDIPEDRPSPPILPILRRPEILRRLRRPPRPSSPPDIEIDPPSESEEEEDRPILRRPSEESLSRRVNEEARGFNAGGCSATTYSLRNEFSSDNPSISPQASHVSPSHNEFGYNRFEEIEGSSGDDDGDDEAENSDYELSADDGEDHEKWEDCEDGEDLEETD